MTLERFRTGLVCLGLAHVAYCFGLYGYVRGVGAGIILAFFWMIGADTTPRKEFDNGTDHAFDIY